MRLATYNIWNSKRGMPERKDHIINEIKQLKADVIALQEVPNAAFSKDLKDQIGYGHEVFAAHDGYEEGLTLLSKHPILKAEAHENVLLTVVDVAGIKMALVNVHYPYDSALAKEKGAIHSQDIALDQEVSFRFILGDFNCDDSSSVHHFLKGARSLHGAEAKPYWIDLGEVAEEHHGFTLVPTLDLKTNPRWKDDIATDTSARVDCIFLHDCFPGAYPVMTSYENFGKEVHRSTGLCSSDHYGIVVDLQLPEEKK